MLAHKWSSSSLHVSLVSLHPPANWELANTTQAQPEPASFHGLTVLSFHMPDTDSMNQCTPLNQPIPSFLCLQWLTSQIVFSLHPGESIYSQIKTCFCCFNCDLVSEWAWNSSSRWVRHTWYNNGCVSEINFSFTAMMPRSCLRSAAYRGQWLFITVSNMAPACVLFPSLQWGLTSRLALFTNVSCDRAGVYMGLARRVCLLWWHRFVRNKPDSHLFQLKLKSKDNKLSVPSLSKFIVFQPKKNNSLIAVWNEFKLWNTSGSHCCCCCSFLRRWSSKWSLPHMSHKLANVVYILSEIY